MPHVFTSKTGSSRRRGNKEDGEGQHAQQEHDSVRLLMARLAYPWEASKETTPLWISCSPPGRQLVVLVSVSLLRRIMLGVAGSV